MPINWDDVHKRVAENNNIKSSAPTIPSIPAKKKKGLLDTLKDIFKSNMDYKEKEARGEVPNLPAEIGKGLVSSAVKVGLDIKETPKVWKTQKASQRAYNVPFLGKTKSHYSDFETEQNKVIEGKDPLYHVLGPMADVILGATDIGGIPKGIKSIKGISKGVKEARTARTLEDVIPVEEMGFTRKTSVPTTDKITEAIYHPKTEQLMLPSTTKVSPLSKTEKVVESTMTKRQLNKYIKASEKIKKAETSGGTEFVSKEVPSTKWEVRPTTPKVDENVSSVVSSASKKGEKAIDISPNVLPEHKTLVEKLVSLIPDAKKLKEAQKALTAKNVARQAAAGKSAIEGNTGFEAMYKARAAQKGAAETATDLSIAGKFADTEKNTLAEIIRTSKVLDPAFEKPKALEGLQKLLNGHALQENEISLLEDVFGRSLASRLSHMNNVDKALAVANIPRTLKSTADFSASFRQSLKLGLRNPKVWAKEIQNQFKYAFNKEAYKMSMDTIMKDDLYALARKHKLELTNLKVSGAKEEAYIADELLSKVPILGQITDGSERAYVGLLNNVRFEAFRNGVKSLEKAGKATPKELDALANVINIASGRGPYTKKWVGKLGEVSFFAPRYWSSNLQYLNPAWYKNLPPMARKEALKGVASYLGFGASVLSIAKMSGAEVEINPLSNNFGRFKPVGTSTWIDIFPTGRKEISLIAQILMQKRKTSSGETKKLSDIGGEQKESTGSLLTNYVRGKLSPLAGQGVDWAMGENVVEEKPSPASTVTNLTVPIYATDLADAIKTMSPDEMASVAEISFLGIFGFGSTQDYEKETASQIKDKLSKTQNSSSFSNWFHGRDEGDLTSKFMTAAKSETSKKVSDQELEKRRKKSEEKKKSDLKKLMEAIK